VLSVHPAGFDASALDRMLSQWAHGAQRGAEILLRSILAKHVPPGREVPYELSLVAMPVDDGGARRICLVHWSYAPTRKGRVVDISADGYAIAPAFCKVKSFAGCDILHPAIGVHIRWKSGDERAQIPQWVVRMKAMWEVALGASDSFDDCVGCQEQHGPGDSGIGSQCSLCLQTWHSACCKEFCASDSYIAEVHDIVDPPSEIPAYFCDTMCDACRRWVSRVAST
jgi:hypothetical protein